MIEALEMKTNVSPLKADETRIYSLRWEDKKDMIKKWNMLMISEWILSNGSTRYDKYWDEWQSSCLQYDCNIPLYGLNFRSISKYAAIYWIN